MQLHVLLQAQGSVREQSPPLANLTPAERGRNLILPLTWKSPHSLLLKACSKTLEVPNHSFLFPNLKVYSHHLPSFFKPLFQGENFCRYSPASCVKTLVWDSSPRWDYRSHCRLTLTVKYSFSVGSHRYVAHTESKVENAERQNYSAKVFH